MGLGRFADAVVCCKKAIEIKPDSGLAYVELAVAYDCLGDYDKAVLCAERSLSLFEQGLDNEKAGKAKMLLMEIQKDREKEISDLKKKLSALQELKADIEESLKK